MRIPIPRWFDSLMDLISVLLFPSRKHINFTLAVYICLITAGLVWYTANWLWLIAVPICTAFAYILIAWMF